VAESDPPEVKAVQREVGRFVLSLVSWWNHTRAGTTTALAVGGALGWIIHWAQHVWGLFMK
jgi:hypothetical protein